LYRLNVFPIRVPPLRERKDDIPVLVQYLVGQFARRAGKRITEIEKKTVTLLEAYDWQGNIRELQNVIERASSCAMQRRCQWTRLGYREGRTSSLGQRFLPSVRSLTTGKSSPNVS